LPSFIQTKPYYFHPVGCQIIGDCLVVPVETGSGSSYILFLDVSDPINIREINPASRIRRDFHDAGAVGVTNFAMSGKDYWLLCAYDNGATDFYVSSGDTFPGTFQAVFSLILKETEFQSLCMFTDIFDNIFLIGLLRTLDGKDMATLFSLDLQNKKITEVSKRHFKTTGPDDIVGGGPHFRWGAGLEVVSATE